MSPSAITVREARDEEHERCRSILPECFFPSAAPELFVAVDRDDCIQGVAAVLWSAGGFPLQLHVLEAFRRRGIGRALVDSVIAAARGETGKLRNWSPVAENGAGASFLHRMGFVVERRLHGFEADCLGKAEEARRFYDRLKRWIPPDARIVTLDQAPAQELAQLVAREFGAAPAFVAARLQSGAVYSPKDCVVALHGARVVGAVLAVREGSCLRVDVNVVTPEYRRGWASPWLIISLLQLGLDAGLSRFRFFCDDDTRDTLALARRLEAHALEPALLFAKSLA